MYLLHLTHLHRFQLLTIRFWRKTVFASLFLLHVLSIDTFMIMERVSEKIHCLSAKDCLKLNKC